MLNIIMKKRYEERNFDRSNEREKRENKTNITELNQDEERESKNAKLN